MIAGSRRGSIQTVQGFCVSILPQLRQIVIFSSAVCKAEASGAMICSRFLIRNSAARRAERGPSPGSRASSWIRRSISGPATAVGMEKKFSKKLESGRQRQTARYGFHLLFHQRRHLAPCFCMRGDNQVFDDFLLAGLDERGVDPDTFHIAL